MAINTTQNVKKVWAIIGSPFTIIRLTRKVKELFKKKEPFLTPLQHPVLSNNQTPYKEKADALLQHSQ